MAVRLLFFAQACQWVGTNEVRLDLDRPVPVRQLFELMPRIKPHAASLRVAVNHEYAEPGALVKDGDEVAFLPPFSGG